MEKTTCLSFLTLIPRVSRRSGVGHNLTGEERQFTLLPNQSISTMLAWPSLMIVNFVYTYRKSGKTVAEGHATRLKDGKIKETTLTVLPRRPDERPFIENLYLVKQ
jgi:hypothetical protein